VKRALEDRGAPVFFLDQQRVLDTCIELAVDGTVSGRIAVGGTGIAIESITGSYFRPYDVRRMHAVESSGPGSGAEAHAVQIEDAVTAWAEVTPALVLNRPSDMASNNSKPYQAGLIRRSGLSVPETLITTDPDAVRQFERRHGTVIYKSISGVRSIVKRLEDHQDCRLADVANCPTQFQRYIDGTEYRAHVVGKRVFACEVISNDVDYRYPRTEAPRITACLLPDTVAERCLVVSEILRLPLAGIDLRKAPSGDWYCFEANPSPGFTFYEDTAGLPITDAIADLLIGTTASEPVAPHQLTPRKPPLTGYHVDRV
jgi:hypothetical protein